MSFLRRVHVHLGPKTSYPIPFPLASVPCAGPKWLNRSHVGPRSPGQCPQDMSFCTETQNHLFFPRWQPRTLHIFAMRTNVHKYRFIHTYTCASSCLLSAEGSLTPVSWMQYNMLCPRNVSHLHTWLHFLYLSLLFQWCFTLGKSQHGGAVQRISPSPTDPASIVMASY